MIIIATEHIKPPSILWWCDMCKVWVSILGVWTNWLLVFFPERFPNSNPGLKNFSTYPLCIKSGHKR